MNQQSNDAADATPASAPPASITDFEKLQRDFDKQAEKILPFNKTALFDALAAAGVITVAVNFDGCGDSGQIEEIAFFGPAEAPMETPDGTVDLFHAGYNMVEPQKLTLSVEKAVEEMVYALLRNTHDGWENNDGAYGDFEFDVEKRTITLDHNERYIASENFFHEF